MMVRRDRSRPPAWARHPEAWVTTCCDCGGPLRVAVPPGRHGVTEPSRRPSVSCGCAGLPAPALDGLWGQTVALVGCSASKLEGPARAADLYTGQLFRAARRWAETFADHWYILSAKHHVLSPDDVVEPYDLSLAEVAATPGLFHPAPVDTWAIRCRAALMAARGGEPRGARVLQGDRVVMLAGASYCEPLVPLLRAWGGEVETPLAGLGIGRQKAWLAAAVAPAQGELFGGAGGQAP